MIRRAILAALVVAACTSSAPRVAAPVVVAPLPPPPSPPDPDAAPLAMWPAITTGVLPNGLTYYVLPAHNPANRAFVWLAINAGSTLEDEDQRGLAHFVEHMAFKGTKRFPHHALLDFLKSAGVTFGPDLNGHTWQDYTTLELEVPTDRPGLVDTSLDILRDWAADITFDAADIDAERGPIREEWRINRGPAQRMFETAAATLYAGTHYTDRRPVGMLDVIDHAPREALLRYYKDWYRPDLMAVIVVGDVDPAAIERQIRAKLGDLANPPTERPRHPTGVPTGTGTRVVNVQDAEVSEPWVEVYDELGARPHYRTRADARRDMTELLALQILGERYATVARRASAPFVSASASIDRTFRELSGLYLSAQTQPGETEAALRGLLTERARLARHGVGESELSRARTWLGRWYADQAAGIGTHASADYMQSLVGTFLAHDAMLGPEGQDALARELLPQITTRDLAAFERWYPGKSRVVVVSGPPGAPVPAAARVDAITSEVAHADLAPWVDTPVPTQLMAHAPAAGTITAESTIPALGVTVWTLGNGARVIVKPTDFDADTVLFSGASPGGLAAGSDAGFADNRFANEIAELGGAGDMDDATLGRILVGKSATLSTGIEESKEWLRGQASAKDVDVMLQLAFLRMTAPRRDDAQLARWRVTRAQDLRDADRDPLVLFEREWTEALWNHDPRVTVPPPEAIAKVDADKALAFYRDRFGDASDFTFVIVGAVDLAKLRPLVETYLAGLPGHGRHEVERDRGIRQVGGAVAKTWKHGAAPRALVRLELHTAEPWSREKARDLYILGRVLGTRLHEHLREDKGGIYDAEVEGEMTRGPRPESSFSIAFGCDPARATEMAAATRAEIRALATSGLDEAHLAAERETYVREREVWMRSSSFWLGWLEDTMTHGEDPSIVLDPNGALSRMTSARVKAAAKHFLLDAASFQAVLLPDPAAAPAGT